MLKFVTKVRVLLNRSFMFLISYFYMCHQNHQLAFKGYYKCLGADTLCRTPTKHTHTLAIISLWRIRLAVSSRRVLPECSLMAVELVWLLVQGYSHQASALGLELPTSSWPQQQPRRPRKAAGGPLLGQLWRRRQGIKGTGTTCRKTW